MSGEADTHSNPSDFDFGDMQQENDEEIEVMKPDTQKIDVNLMMVLNRFPLSEEIVANFGLYQIKYSQLKGLEREDLIKLGISDNKLQEEMLDEFQFLDGQDPTIKETIGNFRTDAVLVRDGRHMIDSIQEHLVQINTLLRSITYQLERSPSAPSGIVINQQFCSSKVVMELITQLRMHAGYMQNVIEELGDPERHDLFEKRKRRTDKKFSHLLIAASGVGILVAGFFLIRRFGVMK